jgi:O-antigen ligase
VASVSTGFTFRQYAAAAALGSTFALGISQAISTLEGRHTLVLVAGLLLLSATLVLAHRLPDLLVYALAFLIPFTSMEKAFLIAPDTTFVTPGIAIGPTDLCLIALYILWAGRAVVARAEPLPSPTTLDWWVLGFIGAHALSVLSSVSPALTINETVRLAKYAALFFFLEHNLARRHLRFVIAGVLCAILLQSSLGVVQQRTGKLLGIGRTKGASELDYEQYTVTGFESVRRAEGTTFDSHALGLFMSMSLGIPFGIALARELPAVYRAVAALAFVIGLQGLVVAFARAGWVAFAGSAAVLLWFLMRWKAWRSVGLITVVVVALGVPAMLPFAPSIGKRLFEAPPELVSARFETIDMSLSIWRDNPLTGCGANAYMRALELKYSIFTGDPYFIPAHNMTVFMLTEIGVIGVVLFLGLSWVVIRNLWRAAHTHDPLLRMLAASLLGGFVAFHLEGLSDPIYATNVVYFLFWFELGLGAAISRLARASDVPGHAAAAAV